MEIKYTRRITSKSGGYAIGEMNAWMGFALELMEPRPNLVSGKLEPGETLRGLFGITPEEYQLNETDTKALDDLADRIRKVFPRDRFIGYTVVDLKGTIQQRELQLKMGDTVDNGEFRVRMMGTQISTPGPIDSVILNAARLQVQATQKNALEGIKAEWQTACAELGNAIRGLDKIFVAYDQQTGARWPFVGMDGRVEIFTTIERAEKARKEFENAFGNIDLWEIREIAGEDLEGFFGRCQDQGLLLFRVDNGSCRGEMTLNDFMTQVIPENGILRGNIIRDLQFGRRVDIMRKQDVPEPMLRKMAESMLTARGFAMRDIGNCRLYVITSPAPGGKPGELSLRVAVNAEKNANYLMVFTSKILAAANIDRNVADNCHIKAVKFDEIRAAAATTNGLLIDADSVKYILLKESFDKVVELRSKPPMIVKLKDPKEPEKQGNPENAEAGEQPQPQQTVAGIDKPSSDAMGSLPDPDAYPQNRTEPAEAKKEERKEEAPPVKETESKEEKIPETGAEAAGQPAGEAPEPDEKSRKNKLSKFWQMFKRK